MFTQPRRHIRTNKEIEKVKPLGSYGRLRCGCAWEISSLFGSAGVDGLDLITHEQSLVSLVFISNPGNSNVVSLGLWIISYN